MQVARFRSVENSDRSSVLKLKERKIYMQKNLKSLVRRGEWMKLIAFFFMG